MDLWTLSGLILINGMFSARVLVQWIASERAGRCVVPVSFWWISSIGAVWGIIYSLVREEIAFVFGFGVTLVPYVRNLVIHYRLGHNPRPSAFIIPFAILLVSILLSSKWETADWIVDGEGSWFCIAVAGISIFYSRFFIQWIHSEKIRLNVMPLSFWICSLAGSMLLLVYSIHILDPVYILSYLFNSVPYMRNIFLLRSATPDPSP
jgi:lipid-A-disaccharide synthase-like uncharacterized protein